MKISYIEQKGQGKTPQSLKKGGRNASGDIHFQSNQYFNELVLG